MFPALIRTRIVLMLIVLTGLWAIVPLPVSAAVEIANVTPADGALTTTWPEIVSVTFVDAIDPDVSTIRLVDTAGVDIPGATGHPGDDGHTLSITPPPSLGNGTYTIIWTARSSSEDDVSQGYSAFTVGTAADGSVVTVPSTGDTPGAPAQWLQTVSTGIALLGMVALMAIWPVWMFIIRPSIFPARRHARMFVRHSLQFSLVALALALIGSLFDLVIHAQTLGDGTWLDRIMNTIGQTRWGLVWTVRIALTIMLGVALGLASWWFPRRNVLSRWLIWVPSLTLPIVFSLTTHGWNPPVGRASAITANIVHITATSLWAGSVLVLLGVLLPSLRWIEPGLRKIVLGASIRRFGILTLATWIPLVITGGYAAWLQIGNRTALTTTGFGRAMMFKLGVTLLTLVIVAIVLMFRNRWSRRGLVAVLCIQTALIGAILLATGQMATMPPARDVVVERATQVAVPVMLGDRPSQLLIAPGTTGINHLRLEVPGARLSNITVARVNVSMPGNPDIGAKNILLSRVSGNNFEHHGTEFSLDGEWNILVGLTEPNRPEITARVSHVFSAEQTSRQDIPATPWRFHTSGGVSAIVLLLTGFGGIILAIFAGKTPLRKEAGGIAVAALALGVVILLQARFDPILAGSGVQSQIDPNDLLMVERGELVYTNACLSCHGADLRGDGPLADTMDPPPADFSAPHTYVHTDEDLIYWIVNGKQNTGMPAFGDQLSDQEIRDVLAYIKNRQQEMGK